MQEHRPLLLEDITSVAKKVEMPNFDGTDMVEWVPRTEKFFGIQDTAEEIKISLALVSMEGSPLQLLCWLQQRNLQLTCAQLREELMQ